MGSRRQHGVLTFRDAGPTSVSNTVPMSFIHGNTPPWQQARFHLGTFRARHLLAEVGTQSMIDSSVQFIDPGRIRIGRAVEILRNSTLDGRSPEPSALVIGNSARLKENAGWGLTAATYASGITASSVVTASFKATAELTSAHRAASAQVASWPVSTSSTGARACRSYTRGSSRNRLGLTMMSASAPT